MLFNKNKPGFHIGETAPVEAGAEQPKPACAKRLALQIFKSGVQLGVARIVVLIRGRNEGGFQNPDMLSDDLGGRDIGAGGVPHKVINISVKGALKGVSISARAGVQGTSNQTRIWLPHDAPPGTYTKELKLCKV